MQMDTEKFRTELVLELRNIFNQIKNNNSIFLPDFEKVLARVELFDEYAHSPTIQRLLIMLRGRIPEYAYIETPLSDKAFLTDLKQLIHFVENVVLVKT